MFLPIHFGTQGRHPPFINRFRYTRARARPPASPPTLPPATDHDTCPTSDQDHTPPSIGWYESMWRAVAAALQHPAPSGWQLQRPSKCSRGPWPYHYSSPSVSMLIAVQCPGPDWFPRSMLYLASTSPASSPNTTVSSNPLHLTQMLRGLLCALF